MKRMISVPLLGLIACTYFAQAQITITRSHIESIFGEGRIQLFYVDTTATLVNIGLTGGPNVYDFSTRPLELSDTVSTLPVTQVPQLAARYSNDAVALWFEDDSEYIIFRILDSGWFTIGEAQFSGSEARYEHIAPDEPLLLVPATEGLTWSHSGIQIDSTYVNGVPTQVETSNLNTEYSIDGWGTLLLPGGDPMNCLRVRVDDQPPAQFKEFLYITQEGAVLMVETQNTAPDTGNIMVTELILFLGGSLVSVEGGNEVPGEFSLFQNYPNPFNPSTTLGFSLPRSGFVTLKLYNTLGEEVATLVSENLTAGRHNVEWDASRFASGVYFYRLSVPTSRDGQAGEFVETKKLILLR